LKNINRISKWFLFVILLLLVSDVCVNRNVEARSDSYILEVEQHWDTFGIGGTCISGSHNLAVADVDGDGAKEMVTGGSSYYLLPNGSTTTRSAPLKIWSWDGKNLNLEGNYSWTGNIRCVYAGDADGDGKTELITSGSVTDSSGSYPSLRIWDWNGETLVLKGSYEGKTIGSVAVGDLDRDGKPEIIAVGTSFNGTKSVAQLSIFRWDGASLTLNTSVDWYAHANSVYVYDLDNDGVTEIVTAGYGNDLNNSRGQLRVWQFDGTNLSLKSNAQWCMIDGVYSVDVAGNVMGNTLVSNVKVADVDGDGVPEIVTGGFTYNGTKAEGQLKIWNWSGGVLNLERSQEWVNLDITQPTSISINDVDGDGKKEIVTSGYTAGYGSWAPNAFGKSRAELKVWSWDGNTLTLKQSKDWIVGEAVSAWNVGTGDVDNDGIVEIVTVGCMETGNLCDPDLRIWSLPTASEVPASFPYLPVVVSGAAVTAIAAVMVAFMLMRKRRQ
jgi:hypothetical protein